MEQAQGNQMKVIPRQGETYDAAYNRMRSERLKELQKKPVFFKKPEKDISPRVVGMVRRGR